MSDNKKTDNNRSRLLLLLRYLQKNTDDEHVASVADITAIDLAHAAGVRDKRIREYTERLISMYTVGAK